jgi:hypothetical protein
MSAPSGSHHRRPATKPVRIRVANVISNHGDTASPVVLRPPHAHFCTVPFRSKEQLPPCCIGSFAILLMQLRTAPGCSQSNAAQHAHWNMAEEGREIELARASSAIAADADKVLVSGIRALLDRALPRRGPLPAAFAKRAEMPPDRYDKPLTLPAPRECDHMASVSAGDRQWFIGSALEEIVKLLPQPQQLPSQGELNAAIAPLGGKMRPIVDAFGQFVLAHDEVDGATVIGVDQGEIPEFGSLIEIGHTRQERLQSKL